MSKRSGLREFQAHLATRLAGASGQNAAGMLGVQAGTDFWLVNLSDSGEVVPLPALAGVPLAQPWFAGMANVRGSLYAVSDFSAFHGHDLTPRTGGSRLLLVGPRFGNNVALLVARMLGLRNVADLTPVALDPEAPPWADEAYVDKEGRHWRRLNVRRLLAEERFMNIGV